MQDIPADTEKRGPSSRVLQEVIRQAPAGYVTVGWLDIVLAPAFVRHNHAVSWTAGDDTGRLHGARAYPRAVMACN